MAKKKHTSKTSAAPIGPIDGADTLADTLCYAMQDDADPARVWKELRAVLEPYCRSRSTLGHLRSVIHQTGEILSNAGGESDSTDNALPKKVDALFQKAQDGFTEMKVTAAAIAALINSDDEGSAFSMAHQLMRKATKLIEATDSVNVARLSKGGAA